MDDFFFCFTDLSPDSPMSTCSGAWSNFEARIREMLGIDLLLDDGLVPNQIQPADRRKPIKGKTSAGYCNPGRMISAHRVERNFHN